MCNFLIKKWEKNVGDMVVHRRELGDVGFFPILGALICERLFFLG